MGNRYSQYYEAWRQREAAIKAQLRQEKIARDKAIEEHRVEVEGSEPSRRDIGMNIP
jgi:hypothetical protein